MSSTFEAFMARDRRAALADGRSLPTNAVGAALFADISGFTPLTELLVNEVGHQRGAEELSIHLERVFNAVIDQLHIYGGEVIYFSGDAITCWVDGDDGLRAATCGLAIQDAMRRVSRVTSPQGKEVVLGIKVSIAVGAAHRFVVGDPDVQLIDVLAGRLIDELARSEHVANPSEVVLAPSAVAALGDRVTIAERRDSEEVGVVGVLAGLRVPAPAPAPIVPAHALDDEAVRPWVLPAIHDRLAAGHGELLTELRPAFALFVRFGGIDVDSDPRARDHLDVFLRGCQAIVTRYGGNILQLTIGDKGAYVYGAFGAPQAHEDDGVRAATACLELLALDGVSAARDLQIGLTHGRLRSGTYGHVERRAFGCLGDTVNLSARLMAAAPPGHIYCTDVVRATAGTRFRWESVGDVSVKGKAQPVGVHSLLGAHETGGETVARAPLPLVGRATELAALATVRDDVLAGEGRVVAIRSDGGRGKTRLLRAIADDVVAGRMAVVHGTADAYVQNRSYLVWRDATRTLFGIDDTTTREQQIALVERVLDSVALGFSRRAPLVGPILGLDIDDNDMTASFDAKLRKASLEALLTDAVRARAEVGPVAFLLDDAQWMDPLSVDLLDLLVRSTIDRPVLVVVAYRPVAAATDGFGLDRYAGHRLLELGDLDDAEAATFVAAKVTELWGGAAVASPATLGFVIDRADGNPLYLEALLEWIHGRGLDPGDVHALQSMELPDGLQSLVLSRIDALAESPRRSLKIASVVGRRFTGGVLGSVYPELGALASIDDDLDQLARADMVLPDVDEAGAWGFRHLLTREVAYDSMPFTLRTQLHGRCGAFFEEHYAGRLDVDMLAHHYWHSDDEGKKRTYLDRAGAAAQANYANAAAIDYFERLATLLSGVARAEVLLRLGKVLELAGDWGRAQQSAVEALAISRANNDDVSAAWSLLALAEIDRKQGHYGEARRRSEDAANAFDAAGVDTGTGQVLHLAGTIAAQEGAYERAREAYEASLEVRERLEDRAGMASVLSNLGVVAEYTGAYRESLMLHERALRLREEIGDRWAIAVSHTNIGMIGVLEERFEDARVSFLEAMRLNVEVGDVWMVAISHNNLGNALRGLGDHGGACAEYAAAARTVHRYRDQWALAFLLEDVAALAAAVGRPERAYELLGAADGQRAEIGSPRAPALEESLGQQLAQAAAGMPEARLAGARERGAALDTDGAVRMLLEVCEQPMA